MPRRASRNGPCDTQVVRHVDLARQTAGRHVTFGAATACEVVTDSKIISDADACFVVVGDVMDIEA